MQEEETIRKVIWESGYYRIVKVIGRNSILSYGFEVNLPDLLQNPSWRMEEKVTSANSPIYKFLEWFEQSEKVLVDG